MVLHLIGINHFDPLVPPLLSEELRRLSASHADPPAFVAVEYDQRIFERISSQRPEFERLVRLRWPEMLEADVKRLVTTLGYEGDSHLEVFPQAPTLWLDCGREAPTSLDRYAADRLKLYVAHAMGEGPANLDRISESLRKVGLPMNGARDEAFASHVVAALDAAKTSWAIAIAGWCHTDAAVARSMASLLVGAGVECTAVNLCCRV